MKFSRLILGAIGAVLLIDALAFIAFGRVNFGVIVPFFVGAALLLLALYRDSCQAWVLQQPLRIKAWWLVRIGFLLWLASLFFFFLLLQNKSVQDLGVVVQNQAPTAPKAIIVLGSGTPNCEASRALIERLRQGMLQASKAPAAWLVVSGGVDFGHSCTEAEVMAKYLSQQGFDMTRVLQESESTSTHENMIFSERLLRDKGINKSDPIQIVTNDFHTIRSEKIATRAGYTNATLIAAPTPLYMRYNAWTREYFAFISGWMLNEY